MSEMLNSAASNKPAVLAHDLQGLIRRFKRRLRDQTNVGDLTWAQVAVLAHLERDGPATVTALARAEGMRPQSMGAIVSALEGAGHVKGVPDPSDGRQTILSLTDACREWFRIGRAARQDWLARAIETHLTPEEQDELVRAMALLKRIVGS